MHTLKIPLTSLSKDMILKNFLGRGPQTFPKWACFSYKPYNLKRRTTWNTVNGESFTG